MSRTLPNICYICTSHTRQKTHFCPCLHYNPPQQQSHAQPRAHAIALSHLPIILPIPDRTTHRAHPSTTTAHFFLLVSGACTCLLYTPIACIYVTRQAPPDPSLAIPSELASRLRLRNTQHACAPSSSQLLQNSQLCNCRVGLTGSGSRSGGTCSRVLATSGFPSCLSVLSACATCCQSEPSMQVRCCVLACVRVSRLISLVFCMNSCHICSLCALG